MSKSDKTPTIRFKDFSGEWKPKILGDVLKYEQPQPYIVTRAVYDDRYKTPVLTAGQSFILGYTHETEGIKTASEDDPVIIFDDFMTTSHYVDFPFKVKSSAMKLLTIKDTTLDDAYYAYLALAQMRYNVQNHERHWISKFAGFDVLMPEYDEQKKIGLFFFDLNSLIESQREHLEKTRQIKYSFMNGLFAQITDDLPEFRFAEYSHKWCKKNLYEIASPYTDFLPTPTDGYTRLGIRSHMKGTFYEYVAPSKQLGEKRLQRVKRNNFIVNIVFAWEHAIAVTTEEDEGKLVSHRFPQFSFNEGMYPRFFHYALSDERFRHHLWLASPSGAGRNKTLRIDEMMEYELRVPEYEEQKKIADFLTSLDELIELYDCQIAKLQNIKAACLQGMFV